MKIRSKTEQMPTSGAIESPGAPILEKKRPRPDALGGLFWLCMVEVRLSPAAPVPPSCGVVCNGSADTVLLGLGCGVPSRTTMGRFACTMVNAFSGTVLCQPFCTQEAKALQKLSRQHSRTTFTLN